MSWFRKDKGASAPESAEALACDSFPFVPVLWHGEHRMMRLKKLNSVQLNSCGDFSHFANLEKKKSKPKQSHEETIRSFIGIRSVQDNVAKAVMVSPSYDEIVSEFDRVYPGRLKALEELEKIREELKKYARPDVPGAKQLLLEADCLQAQHSFPLPEDTYAFLMAWATGADKHEIDKFRKEVMIRHAVQSEKTHRPPSEICGAFDDADAFLREDYDRNCFYYLQEARDLLDATKGR